jgi:fatty acid desaturase
MSAFADTEATPAGGATVESNLGPVRDDNPVITHRAKLRAGELKALAVRSDAKALPRLFGHLGVLACTGALVWMLRDSLWVLPALVAHGYVLSFLFCPFHEAAHATAFRSRWLNQAVGHFAGFTLLLPFGYYRRFHWDHHRYTQDPERDPELAAPKPRNAAEYVWHVCGMQNWKRRISNSLGHALRGCAPQPWIDADHRRGILLEARLYLLAYALAFAASVALQSWALVWLWIVPGMIGQFFIRQYLLAEHTGCGQMCDMLEMTRTIHTNALVRFFAWNMPYHAEHHAYPAVPFHALPALHAKMQPWLQHETRGYVRTLAGAVARTWRGS